MTKKIAHCPLHPESNFSDNETDGQDLVGTESNNNIHTNQNFVYLLKVRNLNWKCSFTQMKKWITNWVGFSSEDPPSSLLLAEKLERLQC